MGEKKDKNGTYFKEYFSTTKKEDIYRTQMNGLADSAQNTFTPVSMAAIVLKGNREQTAMEEWVDSYVEAAKELAAINQYRSNGSHPHCKPIYKYYYTLPAIFLARHAAELAIKEATQKIGGEIDTHAHNLVSLWHSFLSNFPKSKPPKDKNISKNILSFLEILSHLDDDGTKVRYPANQKGQFTHEEFEWVNCADLTNKVQDLISVLRAIDYNAVKAANKKEDESKKARKERKLK